MPVDVEECVYTILCGLSASVRNALQNVITSLTASLNAQIVAYRSALLVYDVAVIPLELSRSILNGLLDIARSAATLVPLEIIEGCADLGDFNLDIVTSIDVITAELNDVIDDLNRILSFKDELEFLINELSAVLDNFNDISLVLEECAQA